MSGAHQVTVPTLEVRTRSEQSDDEVDRVFVWAFQRRKVFIAALALVCAGVGAGWKGIQQIQAAAEERLLRTQAAKQQSDAVDSNGMAVAALGERVGRIEESMAVHAEMTRTGVELLMASPQVVAAIQGNAELQARAAKVVGRDTE